MTRRTADTRPIEARRAEWLRNYPDKFLVCRGGHDFPKPVPGRHMTRTRITPWYDDGPRNGEVLIVQKCKNCGRERWRISGPRGLYHSGATSWHYSDPPGYASPPGLGISRADYLNLYWERVIDGDKDLLRELEEIEQERKAQGNGHR
jgi:hypothetical protein